MATKTPNRSGYFSIPTPPDFILEMSKGNLPGYETLVLEGYMNGVDNTLQDLGFFFNGVESTVSRITLLPGATELFVSSSSASDTAVTIQVEGVDTSYNKKTASVTLNGQNQVSLGTGWFRVNFAENNHATLSFLGKVYIAESDTLTAGVPDTDTKVQGFIHIDPDTGVSQNIMKQFIYTVPAGHTLFFLSIRVSIGDLLGIEDTVLCTREISVNGAARKMISRPTYSSGVTEVPLNNFTKFQEKTDIIIAVRDPTPSAAACANVEIDAILVEDTEF